MDMTVIAVILTIVCAGLLVALAVLIFKIFPQKLETQVAEHDKLKTQLEEVVKSNDNALRLVHLFELSLRITVVVLHNKHKSTTDLVAEYEKSRREYKELYEEFDGTVKSYQEFREEVGRKVKHRLVRGGVGTALSLIPGAGLLQVAGDLIDLANFAADTAEDASDAMDVLETFGNKLLDDPTQVLLDATSFTINLLILREYLLNRVNGDQTLEPIQADESTINEIFEKYLSMETLDAADLDAFVKDMIQYMKEAVASVPEGERRKTTDVAKDFSEFGIAAYAPEVSTASVDRSSP